jgi:methyl-accepting chemotaxis protein
MAIKLSVGLKIKGGFLLVAAIALVLGAIGLYGISTLSEDLDFMGDNRIPAMNTLQTLERQRGEVRLQIYECIVTEARPGRIEALQRVRKTRVGSFQGIDASWNQLLSLSFSGDEELHLLEEVKATYRNWRDKYHSEMDKELEALTLISDGPALNAQYDRCMDRVTELTHYTTEFAGALDALLKQQNQTTNAHIVENTKTGARVYMQMMIFMIAGTLLALSLGFIIAGLITKPIKNAFTVLQTMSEGNLTQVIEAKNTDETGEMLRLLNVTQGAIKQLIVAIRDKASTLSVIGNELSSNMTETAAAINQITANIQSIRGRVINQSASVTETNATMEQITVNIDKLNDNVEQQSSSVTQSSSAIEQMITNIQSVTATLKNNAGNVQQLLDSSEVGHAGLQEVASDIQEIARESEGLMEINAVMENIASQTNLLSMNAAIEAAHAGEAGKGFAVVADEIRKLAESSGEQSKTISSVLKKIKESIDKISGSTDNVLGKFETINAGVKLVSSQSEEIRRAMEEQSEGSQQILDVLSRLNEITLMVKGGSDEMFEGSKEVITEGKNLELATQEITHGMNEMSSGADQINVAVTHINSISGENKDSIAVLIQEVSRFKVD